MFIIRDRCNKLPSCGQIVVVVVVVAQRACVVCVCAILLFAIRCAKYETVTGPDGVVVR